MPNSRGRRPGSSTTRQEILAAAKSQFAAAGYPGATMRSIAREAGVDPRLVTHYFGSKQELFMAVFEMPFVPDEEQLAGMRTAVDGGENAGVVFTRRLVSLLRTPSFSQAVAGLVRAAATEPDLAELARNFLLENLMRPIVSRFAPDDDPLRAALCSTQITGMIMGLLVVGLPPLTDADDDALVAAYAPTFDRYLTGQVH